MANATSGGRCNSASTPGTTADDAAGGKGVVQWDNVGLRFCYMNSGQCDFATDQTNDGRNCASGKYKR